MASVLVDFFYAPPVGHAIEALHHALAIQRADASHEVSLVLNAAAPLELAECCPFLTKAYGVDSPLLSSAPHALASLRHIPREWDWVVSDSRRDQDFQLRMFPGLRDHYAAADEWFRPRSGRGRVGTPPPGRRRHVHLRLDLPAEARQTAHGLVDGPTLALMPAGSSEASSYPSTRSWRLVLDAIANTEPRLGVVLVGRTVRGDGRTSTSIPSDELARLRAHPSVVADVFDRPLLEQLAVVERCSVFLAPHTGFGMAALAVGTPWLAISGGRWFEWYFNRVPFRSVVPDTKRFPSYSQFEEQVTVIDGSDGERIPSMTRARIVADLPRIVQALDDLLHGRLSYRRCLEDYAAALLDAHGGKPDEIWSWDGVLDKYLW